jgi:hypothetical protein
MGNYIRFNLNYEVFVELTDRGFALWQQHDILATKRIQSWLPLYTKDTSLERYLEQRDDDGFVAMQGWQFIEIFGGLLSPGQYFSMNVRLRAEDAQPITI